MEELRAKVEELKEKQTAILKEKNIYDDKANELNRVSGELETEIWDIERQIRELSPALSPADEEGLKRDFDYINDIITGLKDKSGARRDRNLYMYLKDAEEDCKEKWFMSLGGSLEDMEITIYTKSDPVKYAVRRAFIQEECSCTGIEYTEKKRMERTTWFHGSDIGCASYIKYDARADSQSPSK
jgi:hypothetical protein